MTSNQLSRLAEWLNHLNRIGAAYSTPKLCEMESKEAFSRIRSTEDAKTKSEILTSELSKAMQRAESLRSAYFEKLELSSSTEEDKAAIMSLKGAHSAEIQRWHLAVESSRSSDAPCMLVFSALHSS
jgi:hypothetical protein